MQQPEPTGEQRQWHIGFQPDGTGRRREYICECTDEWHLGLVELPRIIADHTTAALVPELLSALQDIREFLGPFSSGWAHKAIRMATEAIAQVESAAQPPEIK